VQLDATIMWLNSIKSDYDATKSDYDATKYDYDVTRCDIIILGFFLNLIMLKLT